MSPKNSRTIGANIAAAFALASLATGCVSLNSVSMTQIPSEREVQVKAESSRLINLGLNFDNDYVDAVRAELKSQCPGGQIRGILTKDEIVTYFLFVHRRRVSAQGYCSKDAGGGLT